MQSLLKNIYEFYRQDCCWPYAASFFLTLIIYWLDFFIVPTRCHWASPLAYGVILAYYLYIVYLYFQNKAKTAKARFFMTFLSSKVVIWGLILTFIYCRSIIYK